MSKNKNASKKKGVNISSIKENFQKNLTIKNVKKISNKIHKN